MQLTAFLPKNVGRPEIFSKTLRVMKLVTALLFVFCLQASATGISQTITYSGKEVSLEKVFKVIKEQTGYFVSYKMSQVRRATPVTIQSKDMPLEQFLHRVLQNQPLDYTLEENTIFIKWKKELYKMIPLESISQTLTPPVEDITLSGRVTNGKQEPLEGVSVTVRGTQNGTITNADGRFSLSVPSSNNVELIFSFVGFESQTVRVGNQTVFNIVLKDFVAGLDDVVVVGYGTQRKKTLTGAVSVIDNDALENRPAAKTTDLLQGLSPGLQISRSNPGNIRGSQNSILIRGVSSRSDPGVLVVIDGIPQNATNASAIDNINPDDIDNISILKDGQAAIYGARAAGGVILITTKSGRDDKPTIRIGADETIQKPFFPRKPVNFLQEVEMQNEGFVNDGQITNVYSNVAKFIKENDITYDKIKNNDRKYLLREPFGYDNPYYLGDYDWYDIMYDPALQQNYNVSVSGKKGRLTYYESINYLDQDGMLAWGSNFKRRLLVTLKNDYEVTDYLKIRSNFRVGTQKIMQPNNYTADGYHGIEGGTRFIHRVLEPFTVGGHYNNIGGYYNPIAEAEASGTTTDLSYMLRGTIGAEITPFRNFIINGELSADYNVTETDWASLDFDMYNALDEFSQTAKAGLVQAGADYSRNRYMVGNLNANYSLNSKGHNAKLLAGYSIEGNTFRTFGAYRRYGLISPNLPTMSVGAADEQYNSENKNAYALNSVYSRLEYGFKNRYLFEGIFRYDGSSKFAKGHKWAPFVGVSAGWVISEEAFMKRLENTFDFLKLRVSWGQLGNQSGIGLYDYLYQIAVGGSYPAGSWLSPTQGLSATLGALPSTTRTWEKIESKNLGLDFVMLSSRLTGTFDFYIKDNKNMFFNQEFPKVLGATPPNINGAFVRTKGWEAELGWQDKVGKFGYFFKVNFSNNTTRVEDLKDAIVPVNGPNTFVQGYPYNVIFGYVYDGLIQTDEELSGYKSYFTSGIPALIKKGDVKYKDLNGDGKLTALPYEVGEDGKPKANSGDLVAVGDGAQHYFYGFTLGANWKNFDFRVFFQGVLKWQIYSALRPDFNWYEPNNAAFYHRTWSPDRSDVLWPRLSQNNPVKNYNYAFSDAPYFLFNNKYLRLKNIQLGYTVTKTLVRRLGINQMRVYFSGADVWEYAPVPIVMDPETPNRENASPFPRQYSFGLTLTL